MIKDLILLSRVTEFAERFGLAALDATTQFEHFCNYFVISKHHPDSFELSQVHVGGGGDSGFDGVAIIVNDHVVSSVEDVEYLLLNHKRFEVQFVFLQAKTGPSFDLGDLGKFLMGVRRFFSEPPLAKDNEMIKLAHDIKNEIYRRSDRLHDNPSCYLYYVATGVWHDQPDHRSFINSTVQDLRDTQRFSDVKFVPLGGEEIKRIHREVSGHITRSIEFVRCTPLPSIERVNEAYIGVLPVKEYLKLVVDESNLLNRGLFYDNVRDFQGDTMVNIDIGRTLDEAGESDRFALLNNGVTIVAKKVRRVSDVFHIEDFQIVNGCQTSHVIFRHRESLTDKVYVPVKLIVTDDPDVMNQVIRGTNQQNEVKREAFASLAPFQKRLEDFYLAMERGRARPFYYERRSRQHEQDGIKRDQVITLSQQIQCVLAMFMDAPHSTHRYYGELLSGYANRIFVDTHSPFPYYVAGVTFASLERAFSYGKLGKEFRPYRHHMLMLIRFLLAGEAPPFTAKTIEPYCSKLLDLVRDEQRLLETARRAGTTALETQARMGGYTAKDGNPITRTRDFTAALIGRNGAPREPEQDAPVDYVGTVDRFDAVKGYGFIDLELGGSMFVHVSDVRASGLRELPRGQRVSFDIEQMAPGRFKAVKLKVLA